MITPLPQKGKETPSFIQEGCQIKNLRRGIFLEINFDDPYTKNAATDCLFRFRLVSNVFDKNQIF